MSTLQIQLTDQQREAIEVAARRRRMTPEQLLTEAAVNVAAEEEADEHQRFLEWREAMLKVEGIWADRDDLPDFDDIRRSLDRDLWSR